jgi:hypothetical protein
VGVCVTRCSITCAPKEIVSTWRFTLGKPEGKYPVARTSRRWEVNIETDVKALGMGCGLH